MQWRSLAILGMLVVLMFGASAQAQDAAFADWLQKLKDKAVAQGISLQVVEEALADITPDATVVRLDRKQPETKISLTRYLDNTVTEARIEKGHAMLAEHAEILEKISKKYGVQPKYIVALWAIESDFGRQKGDFSVIRSLATLAYEGRRAAFFEKELLAALQILQAENMQSSQLRGSWAGAMGHCQFMPSTYLKYAVDMTGDGERDIWNARSDALASIANYLNGLGWDGDEEWGRSVDVPEGFVVANDSINSPQPSNYWKKHGIVYSDGEEMPESHAPRYLVYAGTKDEGAALTTNNFKRLLQWNRSRYFATAVGTLADAIGDTP